MLSKEENALLCQVGPGTPMGNLLRRYWMPFAAAAEMDETPTKPVRLMGEDMALYKDKSGTYGLVELHCPHRRADLSYGMVEEDGLRCNYHGWKFNEKGDCLSQPFEESSHPDSHFKDKVKVKAYPVQEKAGLLWAYMGPSPVPELWDWDIYNEKGYKTIVFSPIPGNWLQCAENDIDPVHFEWLHSNWTADLKGERDANNNRIAKHLEIAFEEFEWGYEYKRRLNNSDEWQVGRVALGPNCLSVSHFEWRVPVDDDNTLSVCWNIDLMDGDEPYVQEKVPYFWSPIKDEKTGRWINTHTVQQDIIAWVGQGVKSDRENEHLGASDEGVILLRRKLLDDIKVVEQGGDPKGILRDPSRNHSLHLPRPNGGIGLNAPRPRIGQPGGHSVAWSLYAGLPKEIEDDIDRVFRERDRARQADRVQERVL